MSSAVSPEMETLKSRLKVTWETGDYGRVARIIESTAEAFVDKLDIQPGSKVLDVACGSGNLAVNAANKEAEVTGVDIAENLLETARKRADEMGLDIQFDLGDAEAMPYADGEFDVVMTMFGAMFAPRPELVANELVRVCKPGGVIAMANWTPEGFIGRMFKVAGKYMPPPPFPSPVLWGVPETIAERFGDRVTDLQTTTRLADMKFDFPPAEVVEFFKTYYGPTTKAFEAIPEENREAYRADLEALWAGDNLAEGNRTEIKSEYLEVIAVRK
jgi:ubiquinone/menaquinone biosynthesis C-methylase UbiE